MKKLFILLLLSLPTWAQQYAVVQTNSFTTTGGFTSITEQNTGILSHKLIWTITGTVTTCQVKLEQSSTGAFGGEETDLIANQTCTSNGSSATTSGNANFIRMKVTTLTGGGSVNVTYQGWNSVPTLTVGGTVGVSNLPTTVDTNSGAKSASTQRVVIATDQPQLTNKLLVTPDSVALPANQSVNVAQVNGVASSTGNGTTDTGTQRVTISSDSTGQTKAVGAGANGAATTGNPVLVSGSDGTNTRTVFVNASGELANAVASGSAQADGNSNSINLFTGQGGFTMTQRSYLFTYNGTTWDRMRTASLADEAPSSGAFTIVPGLLMVEKGPRWAISNVSAGGSQGTVSIAAAASKRHVVDCIGFSADSSAAVTAANVTLNVRDGATGAGTAIWSYAISMPTAAALGVQEVPVFAHCGFNLIGTTNTAMTIEFSAGVTGSIQAVNMSGYDIN